MFALWWQCCRVPSSANHTLCFLSYRLRVHLVLEALNLALQLGNDVLILGHVVRHVQNVPSHLHKHCP